MQTLKTYNNTKHELEIEAARLELIKDKIDRLRGIYFPMTTSVSEARGSGNSDHYLEYLIKITKVDPETGMSLDEQYKSQLKVVNKLEKVLNRMTEHLAELEGIEYELYFQIVVKGNSISKAVDKTAEVYDVEPRTVWRCYNKNLKKILKCQ